MGRSRTAADRLNSKLIEIKEDGVCWSPKLIEKIGYLSNGVGSSDFQPTTQQVAVHDELKEQAATYRQRLKLLLEKEVAGFNALLRQHNVPNVIAGAP
jgi:hypothetical protein